MGAFSLSTQTEDELVLRGMEFEGFSRHGKHLVPHAHEATDGEHNVNRGAISGVDHQFVDLARILITAIAHHPGSGRLTAPPRPVVSSATTEDQKQYEYYQNGLHLITSSLERSG